MRTYTIVKKPEILDWSKIPVAPIDNYLWMGEVDITAQAQVCYDEEALYVRLMAKEKNIRAEEFGYETQPCLDSCLEFFFRPFEDSMEYVNIEMNLNLCMWLGYCKERGKFIRCKEDPAILNAKTQRTDDGWELTYRLPVSWVAQYFEGFRLESGKKLYANFYKCGDLTEKEHYIAWSPVVHHEPAFHKPEYFGLTVLE